MSSFAWNEDEELTGKEIEYISLILIISELN
jgi:hypothetical protein